MKTLNLIQLTNKFIEVSDEGTDLILEWIEIRKKIKKNKQLRKTLLNEIYEESLRLQESLNK